MLIPLLGTTLGAACVFFMRKNMKDGIQRSLTGFASGVMVAASVWSLLIPSIEQSESMGRFAFVPALVGLWAGMLFLLLLDNITPHLHINSEVSEGPRTNLKKTTMLYLRGWQLVLCMRAFCLAIQELQQWRHLCCRLE